MERILKKVGVASLARRNMCPPGQVSSTSFAEKVEQIQEPIERVLVPLQGFLKNAIALNLTKPELKDIFPAMELPIYTVTALIVDKHPHAFGYFHDKAEAFKAVEENRCDLCESYYDFVVIEEIMPGIHSIAQTEFWFRWNKVTDHWDPLKSKPDELLGCSSFAMG